MRIGWIMILLLALVIGVIVIASRGPRVGDAPGKEELVYAGPGSPEEVSIIAPILARFEQLNPRYHVRFVHIPGNGYWTKVKTMFAGGVPPDVMYMGGGYAQELAAAGLLLDVRQRLDTPGATLKLDEFLLASLDAYTWQGGIYGIPRDVAPIAVYYNKDLFDASHVPYPTRDWTRDDYLAIARRLTDPKRQQFGCQLRLWQGDYLSTLWASGARILDDGRAHVVIDSLETVDALRFMQDLLHVEHVAPMAQQETGFPLFNARRGGMMYGGYWEAANFRTLSFRWGAVRPPKARFVGSELLGTAYSIAKNSRHADGAWRLAVYMTGAEVQRGVAVDGLAVPARTNALRPEDLAKDPVLAAFVDCLPDAKPPPYVPRWREMEAVLDQHFQRLMLKIETPEQAAQELQKDLAPLTLPD